MDLGFSFFIFSVFIIQSVRGGGAKPPVRIVAKPLARRALVCYMVIV